MGLPRAGVAGSRPIPTDNFERIPRFNDDPYGYGDPDAPPVADLDPAPAGGAG